MKLAYARGYIVTANPDGSVPLNSKIVARADGVSLTSAPDDASIAAAQSLVDSYNHLVDERAECLKVLRGVVEQAKIASIDGWAIVSAAGLLARMETHN